MLDVRRYSVDYWFCMIWYDMNLFWAWEWLIVFYTSNVLSTDHAMSNPIAKYSTPRFLNTSLPYYARTLALAKSTMSIQCPENFYMHSTWYGACWFAGHLHSLTIFRSEFGYVKDRIYWRPWYSAAARSQLKIWKMCCLVLGSVDWDLVVVADTEDISAIAMNCPSGVNGS